MPEEADPETERWTEERAGASTARERDISPETARRREETAALSASETAATEEAAEEEALAARESPSPSVQTPAGTDMNLAPPARLREIRSRESRRLSSETVRPELAKRDLPLLTATTPDLTAKTATEEREESRDHPASERRDPDLSLPSLRDPTGNTASIA